jgi:hypothetical protein
MSGRIPARVVRVAAAILAAGAFAAAAAGSANASEVIYTNIPSPMPGNFASVGNEAYSMTEIGGLVEVAGTARKNPTITVAMSSWACENGNWYEKTCVTTPGTRFEWPVTFSIYEVGPGNTLGAKIAAGSKVFKMPYRPSGSPRCTGEKAGEWYGMGRCWHGKAFKIALPLKVAKLPSQACGWRPHSRGAFVDFGWPCAADRSAPTRSTRPGDEPVQSLSAVKRGDARAYLRLGQVRRQIQP